MEGEVGRYTFILVPPPECVATTVISESTVFLML